ncbi:hypothetical protein [Bradyrhizobium sp. CCBAU 51627]|uniref:hypothetical protein n=1 Tax=Bradyrhizobium sp. CCBAU 51627 TaxID=1325088 RepID=UPI0023051B7C|nr:hypothetical protein [Bradyrhizobium sp. CCBAU 51627]
MNVQVTSTSAIDTPSSRISLTAWTLNSRVSSRLVIAQLRIHETIKPQQLKTIITLSSPLKDAHCKMVSETIAR